MALTRLKGEQLDGWCLGGQVTGGFTWHKWTCGLHATQKGEGLWEIEQHMLYYILFQRKEKGEKNQWSTNDVCRCLQYSPQDPQEVFGSLRLQRSCEITDEQLQRSLFVFSQSEFLKPLESYMVHIMLHILLYLIINLIDWFSKF